MKYLVAGLALIFSFSCSHKEKKATALPASDIPDEWLSLDNDDFFIRYPATWELQDDTENIVFYIFSKPTSSDDTFRDNVNLVIENLIGGMTLDNYATLALKNVRDKYIVTDERKYETDGQVYYHLILKGKDGFFNKQHYYVKAKKAYILTFTYNPHEQETIRKEGEKIMTSFKIK